MKKNNKANRQTKGYKMFKDMKWISLTIWSIIHFFAIFLFFILTVKRINVNEVALFPLVAIIMLTPLPLLASLTYAISNKNHKKSFIPLGSYGCFLISFIVCLTIYYSVHESNQKEAEKLILLTDGMTVVNMIKCGELSPDANGLIRLPKEYQHLSRGEFVAVGYDYDENLCVLFDDSIGFLASQSGYLYTEGTVRLGERTCESNGFFVVEEAYEIIPKWHYIFEKD